jgi:prepilin-type N-terminal cleavage/methylation domain-containing protein
VVESNHRYNAGPPTAAAPRGILSLTIDGICPYLLQSTNFAPMKTRTSAAFTLIELLVVITIIAILASFALPAYTTVQERAQQTKDLSNIKQIGLALKQFATDNNGAFPNKVQAAGGDYAAAAAGTLTSSNQAFWWLFPTYLSSEDIFTVSGSAYSPGPADNTLDTSATTNETMEAGENSYTYISNLTDTSNSIFPLAADGLASGSTTNYAASKAAKGGVWSGKKAIVLFCDASGQIMKVNDTTNLTVKRPGHVYSIFDTSHGADAGDAWLDVSNLVLNPL